MAFLLFLARIARGVDNILSNNNAVASWYGTLASKFNGSGYWEFNGDHMLGELSWSLNCVVDSATILDYIPLLKLKGNTDYHYVYFTMDSY